MMKKLLCILLSFLLVVPAVSCGTGTEQEPDTAASETQAAETETEAFFPKVEKKNYDIEYNMIGFNPAFSWYQVDKMSGEPLNDAIYEMNMRLYEYLGVTTYYKSTTESGVFETVSASIATGDDAWQTCFLHPYVGYNSFITNGYASDLHEFDGLDLEQPYWNKNVIDNLSVNGKAYIGLGDLCKYTIEIIYANKNRLSDALRKMPYDSVRAGTWTWDEFYALSEGLYVDGDGDGQRGVGDYYGFAAMWDWNAASALQAAGFYVASRDSDEGFVISLDEQKLSDFYDGLYTWSQNESLHLWSYDEEMSGSNKLSLIDNHSCFTLDTLGTQFLSAGFDVGILPLPKYDAGQDNYRHVNWGNNLIIPSSVKDKEMIGDVLELRAYLAREIVCTAYYDTVLQYKVSNAADDREMVMLIWNTIVYDPGIAFLDGNINLFNLVYLVSICVNSKTNKLASFLKSNVKLAQRNLDKSFRKAK